MSSTVSQWADQLLMKKAGVDLQTFPQGAFYIVGLPIGNAGDITLRALWILSIADVVAAEDTRETKKLLDRYGIDVPTVSVREHNEVAQANMIIERLKKGERVALVTDAGTPAVSDPGARAVRGVMEAGFRVIPVPGASAVVTALSAAGLEPSGFHFYGFLPPQTKARQQVLSQLAGRQESFVLYEAPHRIVDVLNDMAKVLSPERRVVVAREITKKFETFTAVLCKDLDAWAKAHEPRGEYVILVDEEPSVAQDGLSEQDQAWVLAIAKELPASKAAAVAAKVTGMKRDVIYQWLLAQKH